MILLIKCYLAKLRLFESDIDYFDKAKQGQDYTYEPILLPRLKKEHDSESMSEPLIESGEVERPVRTLIDTINEMTIEEVTQVSPNSLKLKSLVKVPMLMMITAAGFMSGISISMIKCATELIASGSLTTSWGLIVITIIFAIITAICQLHMLNGAMKYFD